MTIKFTGRFYEDDKIIIDLNSVLTKTNAGTEATVSVDSDDLGVNVDDLVYVSILDEGITASIDDTTDVAVEETTTLDEDIEIETVVGDFKDGQIIELKIGSGFEFVEDSFDDVEYTGCNFVVVDADSDEKVLTLEVTADTDEIIIKAGTLEIEATTANEGDVAKVTVKAKKASGIDGTFTETAEAIEVAVVVGEGLSISVDEDEDVPEMWSGVAAGTRYLTDDDDNEALEITIKESVVGAYNEKDEIELVLPEGVWVVEDGVAISEEENDANTDWDTAFANAYNEGDYKSFIFEKRTIEETDKDAGHDPFEIGVTLTLVADPGFVGDVVVEMLVDGESVGEVTIATFKSPLAVEAQQNDLKIDYRNTEVGSDIVVKEAEAGLWAEGLVIGFGIDKFDEDECFEDDMVYTVNEASDMEIDGEDDVLRFEVEEESDEEAAVITISNLSLFMERNIPAGAYDLTMTGNVFGEYNSQKLFAFEAHESTCDVTSGMNAAEEYAAHDCDNLVYINDVQDYSDVVKEGFINIVTAGREQDDASFTTKVVVPVGESYIVAGEQTIALDVPAYVSAAGYTMLPVRAVATGLGINNNNVLCDQATNTVIILYGQRIITLVLGLKVINVNGSVIPA
ncbi:stalk domain-containing protein, partial [Anaerotignum sp.]